MKKCCLIISAAVLCLIMACNNDGENSSTTDTVSKLPVPDNTRVGDTSSYERMPQKLTDSSGN